MNDHGLIVPPDDFEAKRSNAGVLGIEDSSFLGYDHMGPDN